MAEQNQNLTTVTGEDAFSAAGNHAFLLSEGDCVFQVHSGRVDLFAVAVKNGQPYGSRRHLFQAKTGELLFGFCAAEIEKTGIGLLACGGLDTTLTRLDRRTPAQFTQTMSAEKAAPLIDTWITGLTQSLLFDTPPPQTIIQLPPDNEISCTAQSVLQPARGAVLWITNSQSINFIDSAHTIAPRESNEALALASPAWITSTGDTTLRTATTRIRLATGSSWKALDRFHELFLQVLSNKLNVFEEQERARLAQRLDADRRVVTHTIEKMSAILATQNRIVTPEAGDPLLDVCRQVARPLGITIIKPPATGATPKGSEPLRLIAQASRIRTRRVVLQGTWWTQDNGPLIAYRGADKKPVALLQKSARQYVLYDPSLEGEPVVVDAEVAVQLEGFADMLYRTLPPFALSGLDLLKFAALGRSGDITVILMAGLAAGLLGLLTPMATGIIFDTIIPGAQLNQLFMLAIALLVAALSTGVFNFTRSIAILRLEGRMDQHVQGAVWDRLLELPVPFFRNYSSGDLANRAMGINAIRQTISGTTINAFMSGVFSIFSLGLLFWYSIDLAKVAIVLTLIAIVFIAITSFIQLRYQKGIATISGKLSGMVLECITGIAKFRVTGSERRVFAQWAQIFTRQRSLSCKSSIVQNVVETFTAVYPMITTMVIFIMIVWFTKDNPLSTGTFLAFNAAFGQFLQAVLGVFMSVVSMISIIPLYQRCKPILETLPETDDARVDPGVLSGEFEVSHLSFRYSPDGPYILKDVSLHVSPGEFIALVGSSGSGKSTLFRLLMGFERCDSGGIFYDKQELSGLDVRAVRRQIGVVLQSGQLIAGDIFTNIVGSSQLTINDAWEAARMAGLEQDIKDMPMGMHTVVSQGGGGFSGGQRQRLLIARALANKPSILFFDEATSALDNKTQAIVNQSLEKLQTTRVVIAHRLSTIAHADRIFVMDGGKIVQCGTYDELIAQPGQFADLAKRQLV